MEYLPTIHQPSSEENSELKSSFSRARSWGAVCATVILVAIVDFSYSENDLSSLGRITGLVVVIGLIQQMLSIKKSIKRS